MGDTGMSRRIIIAGGTGFIGRHIIQSQEFSDCEIVVLSRNPERYRNMHPFNRKGCTVVHWDGKSQGEWVSRVDGAHAVINLVGDHVAASRWTSKRRKVVIESRTDSVRALATAVNESRVKPRFFLQASAIGYYGAVLDNVERCMEQTSPGQGFLAQISIEWEDALQELDREGIKVSVLRIGVVLGVEDGLLSRMKVPFSMYLGGYFGTGTQILSWIHIRDVIRSLEHILATGGEGVYNLVSPAPVSGYIFSRYLGRVLKRPSWLSMPGFLVKLIFGQMGVEILLKGQWVYPGKLMDEGFDFSWPVLLPALQDILGERQG